MPDDGNLRKFVVTERYEYVVTYHVWAHSNIQASQIAVSSQHDELMEEVDEKRTFVRRTVSPWVDPKKDAANG